MLRTILAAGVLMLGLAVAPTTVRLTDDLTITGVTFTGSEAQAQRTMSDPRYQPGSGSCRDGDRH